MAIPPLDSVLSSEPPGTSRLPDDPPAGPAGMPSLQNSGANRNENTPVLILGAPRSGTTWLGKIFDSHPAVLYRHEPDVNHPSGLPGICTQDQIARLLPIARDYLHEVSRLATLRSAGTLPVFRKSYSGLWCHYLRLGLISAGKLGEKLASHGDRWEKLSLPDCVERRRRADPRIVVKSIISLGRVGLYAEAVPNWRMILLIRHPCGQVASMRRGIGLRKFDGPLYLDGIVAAEQAQRHGLTAERFGSFELLEQLAWNWAVMNEKALEELAGRDNVKIALYDDLCMQPASLARELLDFAGLDWSPQTETFLYRSMNQRGAERYYQVFKETRAEVNKWRTELTPAEQETIMAIVRQTSIARLCPGFAPYLS